MGGKGKRDNGGDGFSRIPTEMQQSVAFHTLSASALRVLLWCHYRLFASKTKPIFTFTNADAKKDLAMPSPVFSRAKNELALKGFLRWHRRGGLRGVNGVMSEYTLCSSWKEWTAPGGTVKDMAQARAAKQRQGNGH